jgi:hypothetical protein
MTRLSQKELTEAAATLRRVLDAFPTEGEDTHSRAIRRRNEGAIVALEVLANEGPSTEDSPLPHMS